MMLREYEHLLRDDAKYLTRAREFSKRVRDISEVFLELGRKKRLQPFGNGAAAGQRLPDALPRTRSLHSNQRQVAARLEREPGCALDEQCTQPRHVLVGGRCIHDEWLHIARSPHPPRGAFSDLGDDFAGGAIE